jgi:antitoxin ParD1/3/4
MARNTSVTLSDDLAGFVEEQVARGHFGSPSEVVHAGLRLLEEREEKREALRAALIEGETSGPPEALDVEAFLAEKRLRHTE